MKKNTILVALMLVLCICMTGCGKADNPAICTVLTSTGESETFLTTEKLDDAYNNAIHFFSPADQEATITASFICPACGMADVWESTTATPGATLLKCKCDNKFLTADDELAYIIVGTGDYFFGTKPLEGTNEG